MKILWQGKLPEALNPTGSRKDEYRLVLRSEEKSILGETKVGDAWISCSPSLEHWMMENYIKGKHGIPAVASSHK